jgi:GTP cyclohydrolase I
MTLDLAQAAFREAPPLTQIVHGPITFVAHCDRHGVPFFGRAYVGYVPTAERLGPATLRRMVKQAARHGERSLERHITSMLQVCIHPAGIALAIRSSHDCTGPLLLEETARRRTAWHGRYRADRSLRSEFLALCATDA